MYSKDNKNCYWGIRGRQPTNINEGTLTREARPAASSRVLEFRAQNDETGHPEILDGNRNRMKRSKEGQPMFTYISLPLVWSPSFSPPCGHDAPKADTAYNYTDPGRGSKRWVCRCFSLRGSGIAKSQSRVELRRRHGSPCDNNPAPEGNSGNGLLFPVNKKFRGPFEVSVAFSSTTCTRTPKYRAIALLLVTVLSLAHW